MVTSIIVGMGEVGRALEQVLSTKYETVTCDINQGGTGIEPKTLHSEEDVRVLHICIPWGEEFDKAVIGYQSLFEPTYTIVHSTVPVGTCKALDVYHSPVRGIHPHLAESMTTFITYLAPKNIELMFYLQKAGMEVCLVCDTDTTEAGKLWSLAAYAVSIVLEKETPI